MKFKQIDGALKRATKRNEKKRRCVAGVVFFFVSLSISLTICASECIWSEQLIKVAKKTKTKSRFGNACYQLQSLGSLSSSFINLAHFRWCWRLSLCLPEHQWPMHLRFVSYFLVFVLSKEKQFLCPIYDCIATQTNEYARTHTLSHLWECKIVMNRKKNRH